MNKYLLCLLPCLLIFFNSAKAQKTICGNLPDTTQTGKISYNNPPLLDTLLTAKINSNKNRPGLKGYRVQIFFGQSRKAANEIKSEFLEKYPEIKAYLIYEQPYFKIRIGDYRNKMEAQKMYHALQPEFNSVIIVPDHVNFPDL